MPYLLLNLRNVPDDEAEEVRALLDAHEIEFYETPAHHWGVSAGAIWVRHAHDTERAKTVYQQYQQQRSQQARTASALTQRGGEPATFVAQLRRRPLQTLSIIALALGLLALFTLPFWLFVRG